ncbi:LiaF transmembrane domain-containing protein [Thermobrachium celere]|uniref:LiaF transmembrane domain-containing protein n=1 Tax=Thermobrachium celere DSM 8682 TaxID=941824 RepID=R7RND5_9CLOT|nr:DUF5668 domain-containing protein [Thermobrachium celere]CDF57524.1 hypothetical protein TCEL_01438 [Thermobrachium celere DSM 8682]
MNGRRKMGLILIIMGILLILSQMKLIDFNSLIKVYWPSLIAIYGIYICIEQRRITSAGLSFVIIGLIVQLWHLDLLPGQFKQYLWPTILIIIGISLIFTQNVTSKKNNYREDRYLDYFAILSSLDTVNVSNDFRGGSITAIMGGAEVDLSQCNMQIESAQLILTAIMGGIEIKLPRDWRVVVTGIPILGGWENKTNTPYEYTKTLYIKCTAILGGIEIKN